MFGSRGAMVGSGGVSDGYEIGSKRPRMMETNPYFAVNSSYQQPYVYGGGIQPSTFPVVRLRGLPFDCSEKDIFSFFAGLDIIDIFLVAKGGRFSGEAFVVFSLPAHAEFALQKDRQNLGRRYVEIFRCKKQDYYQAIAAEMHFETGYDDYHHHHHHHRAASPPPPRPKRSFEKDKLEYTEVLKLRGLPYSVKKSEIARFFGDFNVMDDKVHIGYRHDGKATGEAYVVFSSVEEAKNAMCRDNKLIGTRYIELFPSTLEEARRAESRAR